MDKFLSMMVDCIEDLAQGNPSPNAFKERIAEMRKLIAENMPAEIEEVPAGSEETTGKEE